MYITAIEMTENELNAAYAFLPNHLNRNAAWTVGEGQGCLFETYGDELEFVRSQTPGTVWTVLDDGDGDLCVVSGCHFVNRVGYLISTVAVPETQCIRCSIPMQPPL